MCVVLCCACAPSSSNGGDGSLDAGGSLEPAETSDAPPLGSAESVASELPEDLAGTAASTGERTPTDAAESTTPETGTENGTEEGATRGTGSDDTTRGETSGEGDTMVHPLEPVDPFGVVELYPSSAGGGSWTSEHWSAEGPYALTARLDPHDPQQISGFRGDGSLDVEAGGELVMRGAQPRIYVYPGPAGAWQNVEVTVYYRRVSDDGTAYAGLVIGARSGPDGHGELPCDAHTYYSRLRQDGATDFEKELMHAPSATRSRVDAESLWPADGALPFELWIGWKYVLYNLADGEGVKLESYRDLTGGVGGGAWELVNETIDNGGWFTDTTCPEHSPVEGRSDLIVLDGGTILIRNTGTGEARYRWFSVREIAPP